LGLGVGKCGMGRSAVKSQGNIGELYVAWGLFTLIIVSGMCIK